MVGAARSRRPGVPLPALRSCCACPGRGRNTSFLPEHDLDSAPTDLRASARRALLDIHKHLCRVEPAGRSAYRAGGGCGCMHGGAWGERERRQGWACRQGRTQNKHGWVGMNAVDRCAAVLELLHSCATPRATPSDRPGMLPLAQGQAAAHQKAPMVWPARCAMRRGMEPYRPKGESCRYSNTSRLYRRYGSAGQHRKHGGAGGCGKGPGGCIATWPARSANHGALTSPPPRPPPAPARQPWQIGGTHPTAARRRCRAWGAAPDGRRAPAGRTGGGCPGIAGRKRCLRVVVGREGMVQGWGGQEEGIATQSPGVYGDQPSARQLRLLPARGTAPRSRVPRRGHPHLCPPDPTCGSLGLGVVVALEVLRPPAIGVALLQPRGEGAEEGTPRIMQVVTHGWLPRDPTRLRAGSSR